MIFENIRNIPLHDVQAYLNDGGDPEATCDSVTLLSEASNSGRTDVAELLLDKIPVIKATEFESDSPYYHLPRYGERALETAKKLIAKTPDMNTYIAGDASPLTLFLRSGLKSRNISDDDFYAIAELMIKSGASLDFMEIRSYKSSLSIIASASPDSVPEKVIDLVVSKTSPEVFKIRTRVMRHTPMLSAAYACNHRVLEKIFVSGNAGNVNALDVNKRNALLLAVCESPVTPKIKDDIKRTVDILLKNGVNPSFKDRYGRDYLFYISALPDAI